MRMSPRLREIMPGTTILVTLSVALLLTEPFSDMHLLERDQLAHMLISTMSVMSCSGRSWKNVGSS